MLCQSWGAIKSSPEVGKFLQTSGIVIEDPDALGGFPQNEELLGSWLAMTWKKAGEQMCEKGFDD